MADTREVQLWRRDLALKIVGPLRLTEQAARELLEAATLDELIQVSAANEAEVGLRLSELKTATGEIYERIEAARNPA